MSRDMSGEDKDTRATIRSAKDIKAGLLRRAFDGTSKYTSTEIIAMIQEGTRNARNLPPEHREALKEIDSSQPRSVLMLNALARHEGLSERWRDESQKTTGKSGKTFVMPDHLTMQ